MVRFDVQGEVPTPTREKIIVQDVSGDWPGRDAELAESLLAVVFNQLAERNSANDVLTSVGCEVPAFNFGPGVLLARKPRHWSECDGVFYALPGFGVVSVEVIDPGPVIFGPSARRLLRTGPWWDVRQGRRAECPQRYAHGPPWTSPTGFASRAGAFRGITNSSQQVSFPIELSAGGL